MSKSSSPSVFSTCESWCESEIDHCVNWFLIVYIVCFYIKSKSDIILCI